MNETTDAEYAAAVRKAACDLIAAVQAAKKAGLECSPPYKIVHGSYLLTWDWEDPSWAIKRTIKL